MTRKPLPKPVYRKVEPVEVARIEGEAARKLEEDLRRRINPKIRQLQIWQARSKIQRGRKLKSA